MRLVFAGTPEIAATALERLVSSAHEVALVITRPDAPVGRGRTLTPSPVAHRASELGIEVVKPRSLGDVDLQQRLQALRPDCCAVVAFGGLVPDGLLNLPRHGWVNLHFSLLPAWRGAAPVQHAILHGDDISGATTFRLTSGLDEGPVFGTVAERVDTSDTSGSLLARLASSGAELLVSTLDGIDSGTVTAQPQSGEHISYAPKLTKQDARIRWTDPASAIDRRIRACTPAPGAWTSFRGERVGLLPLGRMTSADEGPPPAPGAIVIHRDAVRVGTGSSSVVLGEVRPSGKRQMLAADWARGLRLTGGQRFE